jgi:hypothetical protein
VLPRTYKWPNTKELGGGGRADAVRLKVEIGRDSTIQTYDDPKEANLWDQCKSCRA